MTTLTVGIDIGGTKISAGLVTPDHTVMRRRSMRTPAISGPDAVLSAVAGLASGLIDSVGSGDVVRAVGVGTAGGVDTRRRLIVSATNHLSAWAGVEIGSALENTVKLPVAVENDARAHAAGEAIAGAGRGRRLVVVAAVGTGVGGAVVLDGLPLSGAHGISGHLGHMPTEEAHGIPCPCGLTGHLESISSGGGLVALYRTSGGPRTVERAEQVIAAAVNDPTARDCVERSAGALGRTLAGVAALIDPDIIIIAGGMAGAAQLWWSAVRDRYRESALPLLRATPLVPAQLGNDAAIVGAAHLARQLDRSGGVRP